MAPVPTQPPEFEAVNAASTASRVQVVIDVNVFISAFDSAESAHQSALQVLQAVDDPDQNYALWLSGHILWNVEDKLINKKGMRAAAVRDYVEDLKSIAVDSGGGYLNPDRTVFDCIDDDEDNRILDLAATVNADLLIANDRHLTSMSPWRGRPVVTSRQFTELAARNATRNRGRAPEPGPVKASPTTSKTLQPSHTPAASEDFTPEL